MTTFTILSTLGVPMHLYCYTCVIIDKLSGDAMMPSPTTEAGHVATTSCQLPPGVGHWKIFKHFSRVCALDRILLAASVHRHGTVLCSARRSWAAGFEVNGLVAQGQLRPGEATVNQRITNPGKTMRISENHWNVSRKFQGHLVSTTTWLTQCAWDPPNHPSPCWHLQGSLASCAVDQRALALSKLWLLNGEKLL